MSKLPTVVDSTQIASVGATILRETVRLLEEMQVGRHFTIAALCSAMQGCMKMSNVSKEQMVEGVIAADRFWQVDDGSVVFLDPTTQEGTGRQEAADDASKN